MIPMFVSQFASFRLLQLPKCQRCRSIRIYFGVICQSAHPEERPPTSEHARHRQIPLLQATISLGLASSERNLQLPLRKGLSRLCVAQPKGWNGWNPEAWGRPPVSVIQPCRHAPATSQLPARSGIDSLVRLRPFLGVTASPSIARKATPFTGPSRVSGGHCPQDVLCGVRIALLHFERRGPAPSALGPAVHVAVFCRTMYFRSGRAASCHGRASSGSVPCQASGPAVRLAGTGRCRHRAPSGSSLPATKLRQRSRLSTMPTAIPAGCSAVSVWCALHRAANSETSRPRRLGGIL